MSERAEQRIELRQPMSGPTPRLPNWSAMMQPLHLAGALPDAVAPAPRARSAAPTLLAHVAPATGDPHRPVGDAARHLGGVELGHRALRVWTSASGSTPRSMHRGEPRKGHRGGPPTARSGESASTRLDQPGTRSDRLADPPRGSSANAARHRSIRRSAAPAAARRDHQSLVPEPLVGERHAVALVADQVGNRHADVLERDERMVVGVRVACRRACARPARRACRRRRRTSRASPACSPPTILAWKKQ